MAKRQKEWARRARESLLSELGNQCNQCGTTEKLTFDCKEARGDSHHKMDTSHRMSFYRSEHLKGNLQILCSKCNEIKSIKERPSSENVPF